MISRNVLWGQTPAQYATYHMTPLGGGSSACRSQVVDKYPGANSASNSEGVNAAATVFLATEDVGNMARVFWKVPFSNLRAMLGHSPALTQVLWYARLFQIDNAPTMRPVAISLYRLLEQPVWDTTQVSNRYYDVANSLPWGGDAGLYAPLQGFSHLAVPFSTTTMPQGMVNPGGVPTTGVWVAFDVTAEVAYCLQANVDMVFMMCASPIGSFAGLSTPATFRFNYDESSYPGFMPYFSINYENQIEFFGATPSGSIDLLNMLNNQYATSGNVLNLGAVERGQIGTAVKAFIKNFASRTFPHLEIWDDWPEWDPPVPATGNTGTGVLAYVTPSEYAVAQQYNIKFSSASAYSVQALAYRDNTAALNPTYGGAGWTGTIGSDLVLPAGGITIPAAAWSGTPVANDVITVYVTGNSTLAVWPEDSNQQVDMTLDSTNAPDPTNWRNINVGRTAVKTAFTINTTSPITVATCQIAPSRFPTGAKIAVANASTVDYGVITNQSATSVTIQFASNSGNAYSIGDKVTRALVCRGLGSSLWAVTTGAAGSGQTNPAQIPLTNALSLGFVTGQTIAIQDPATGNQEIGVISTSDNTKITLQAYLTLTYSAGAVVIVAGSGEFPFWARIDALAATAEELKKFRLNVRS